MPIQNAEHIHRVSSPEQWRQQALEFGTRVGNFDELTVMADEIAAVVNAGRWVLACPYCNSGAAVQPDWALALCYGCGAEFAPTVPDKATRDGIEAMLVARPQRFRNWDPGESLDNLQVENEEHGVA